MSTNKSRNKQDIAIPNHKLNNKINKTLKISLTKTYRCRTAGADSKHLSDMGNDSRPGT